MGTREVIAAKLITRRRRAALFSPVSEGGLVRWYRADKVTLASGAVDVLVDKTGGSNATALGATQRPTYNPSEYTPSFTGDGSNDAFGGSVTLAAHAGITIIVVHRVGAVLSRALVDTSDATAATNVGAMLFFESNTTLRARLGSNSANDASYSAAGLTGQLLVTTATYAEAKRELFANGISKASNTNSVSIPALDRFRINALFQDIYFNNGDVFEVLIFNKELNTAERQAVERDLMHHYGIAPLDRVSMSIAPVIDAVVGIPVSIYFESVMDTATPSLFAFDVIGGVGSFNQTRWTWTPGGGDVGEHAVDVRASFGGRVVATSGAHVIVRAAPTSGSVTILPIGDSLTAAGKWVAQANLQLATAGVAKTWIGTVAGLNAGEVSEGYSGRTVHAFITTGPFAPGGIFSFPAYLALNGFPDPTLVIIELGINDITPADPTDPDPTIDAMFLDLDTLIAAIRARLPTAKIGLMHITPPSPTLGWTGGFTYVDWLKRRIRLLQKEIERYAQRTDGVSLIGTMSGLDLATQLFDNVHPNDSGYVTLGNEAYAWIVGKL